MNMGIRTGMAISMALIISICVAYWFFGASFLMVSSLSFKFDSFCSEALKKEIIQYAENLFLNKPFGQASLNALQNKFSTIAKIDAAYAHPNAMNCTMYNYRPLLFINDSVLLANGVVVDQTLCSDEVLAFLAQVKVSNQHDLYIPFFLPFVTAFPSSFFDYFTVAWIDHTIIELHDKNNQAFTMIGHYQLNYDGTLYKHYQQVKQQLLAQKISDKKQWLIDMRFKNQIIVTQRDMGSL